MNDETKSSVETSIEPHDAKETVSRLEGMKPIGSSVVLIRPFSFAVITIFALSVALALVLFSIFGSYRQRVTVQGELVPVGGLIRLRPQQTGIVVESRVHEGTAVARGDVLFVMTNEIRSNVLGTGPTDITSQIQKRFESYSSDVQKARQARDDYLLSLRSRIVSLETEISQSEEQVRDLQARVLVTRSIYDRYGQLRADGFVTEDALRGKEADLLDQQARLSSARKEVTSLRRMRTELVAERQDRTSAFDREIAELQRSQSLTTQELVAAESKRRFDVRAPLSGVATGVVGEVGQVADGNAVLASIIPKDAQLEARARVPSSAIGFVKVGSRVRLRYAAFPYQRYGVQFGSITSVSRSAMQEREMPDYFPSQASSASNSVYQVAIRLESQSLVFNGATHDLRSGMVLDADVLLGERRIYQWLFEPVTKMSTSLN